ncbi:MAG TPA: cytochrome c maturation protein CcmE [Gallionellaceae bacterium]|nr:cytochrome c maturation protein CcmE [Gallionellaceae bacterium]
MTPRQKRLGFIVAGVMLVAAAVGLVLYALKNNVSLYFTPTQVYNKEAPQGRNFRIGGLVEVGSVKRETDGLTVHFNITDNARIMPVVYKGILPDLFKEGKGVVAQGKLDEANEFRAEEVLAKHDENYMPPEAADALKKAEEAKAAAAQPGSSSSAEYPVAK